MLTSCLQVEKADAQLRKRGTYHHYDDEIRAKFAKYSCIYKSLKFMFAKMSIILEMLNILAATISRFTVLQGLADCCFNNNTYI